MKSSRKISILSILLFSAIITHSQCEDFLQKADILFSQKKYEDAKKQYLNYRECKSNAPGIEKKIADCQKMIEKNEKKKGNLEKNEPTTVNPPEAPENSFNKWYNEGKLNICTNNFPEAIRCFLKAYEIDPSLFDDWDLLAKAYFYQNEYSEAIKYYDKVKEYNRSASMWNNMGVCYKYLNEYDNAIYCFEKSNNISNKGGTALFNLAVCYGDKKDTSKYWDYLKKAARLGHKEAQKILDDKKIKWKNN